MYKTILTGLRVQLNRSFSKAHVKPLSPINQQQKQQSTTNNLVINSPRVLIKCVSNNIFINISNENGNTISKLSAGSVGFKNTQKVSQKSAITIADELKKRLDELGCNSIKLELNGFNPMRSLLIYQIRKCAIPISEIYDTTGVPFNGCRPKKSRRL